MYKYYTKNGFCAELHFKGTTYTFDKFHELKIKYEPPDTGDEELYYILFDSLENLQQQIFNPWDVDHEFKQFIVGCGKKYLKLENFK